MSLTEKNVLGVPLIAFTAVSYVCASCLSLGALPMWRGDNSFLSAAWNNGAGKAGQGVQERDMGGKAEKAEKVGPGQSWELDLAGLLNGKYWKGISGNQGDSSGSEWLPWELCHCTIPTEATDNTHSGAFVLHFLVQFSYFLPQALPLLLSTSFCFLPPLFLLHLWELTLVGLFTQTFDPDMGEG